VPDRKEQHPSVELSSTTSISKGIWLTVLNIESTVALILRPSFLTGSIIEKTTLDKALTTAFPLVLRNPRAPFPQVTL
jgi:hypothetical protein